MTITVSSLIAHLGPVAPATSSTNSAAASSASVRQPISGSSLAAAIVQTSNNISSQRPVSTPFTFQALNSSSNPVNAYVGNLSQKNLAFPINDTVIMSPFNNPSRIQQVVNVLQQPAGYRILAANPAIYGIRSPRW